MMTLTITRNGTGLISLSGGLDLYGVETLRAALLQELQENRPLVLELTGIASCDAAGLQLLCAAEKSASHAQRPITIVGLSTAFRQAAEALGFAHPQFPLNAIS